MKFLIFTDVHDDKKAIPNLLKIAARKDIDFSICAGDFSEFRRGLSYNLKKFNGLGKFFYLIPGNHEEGVNFDSLLKDYKNCLSLHKKSFRLGDYIFLGYGGGGFSTEDAEFRKIAREWYGKYKGEKIVLVTHGPPYGTKLDKLKNGFVGNKDYHRFIMRINPKLAISGHLHETFGAVGKLGETKLVNPGDKGMIIELS